MPLTLLYIANDPSVARIAQDAGVDRIMLDLEQNGKDARQGHLDTVISRHTREDVSRVRAVLHEARLLVRVNPLYSGSKDEIDDAIRRGADILMLPMITDADQVARFVELVTGRVRVCPLIETPQAFCRIDEILEVSGIDEIYVGLNDMHLGMGLDFMFELLSTGMVTFLCERFRRAGIPYGVGGIARIGQGLLPADVILAEYASLGVRATILSRSFFNPFAAKNPQFAEEFAAEVAKVRAYEQALQSFTPEQFEENRAVLRRTVRCIVREKRMGERP